MRRIHLTTGHRIHALADAFTDTTHASTVIGRMLIGLIAFLMMAMMWTERFMTWDKFLQGGQDLELSLVTLIVFLCLIILLARRSQQAVALHLAVFQFVSAIRERALLMAARFMANHLRRRIIETSAAPWLGTFSGICLSPLRI